MGVLARLKQAHTSILLKIPFLKPDLAKKKITVSGYEFAE